MFDFMTLAVAGASVCVDPQHGILHDLHFDGLPSGMSPLRSPDAFPPLDADQTARLSGDFCCENADVKSRDLCAVRHWQAEEIWRSGAEAQVRLRMTRAVQGARVEKLLRLRAGEPILYQMHRIIGGRGRLNVAHHPVLNLRCGGCISYSMKQAALAKSAEDGALHPLARFPQNLQDIVPSDHGHEVISLLEAPGASLGWTAVVREAEEDVIFVLKDPRVLPVTKLRYSKAANGALGGGVLGLEDGCATAENCAARTLPTDLSLAQNRVHVVRQAIGALPRPKGWTGVADIRVLGNALQLIGSDGSDVHLPFDTGFFDLPDQPVRLQ